MQANRVSKRKMEWEGLSILHHWTFSCLETQPLTHRWGMVWQKVQVKDRTQWEVQTVQLLLENESSVAENVWDSLKAGMTVIVNLLYNPTEKNCGKSLSQLRLGWPGVYFHYGSSFSSISMNVIQGYHWNVNLGLHGASDTHTAHSCSAPWQYEQGGNRCFSPGRKSPFRRPCLPSCSLLSLW